MPSVVHRDSHRRLLREFDAGRSRPVDAIIVPAGRPTERLIHAAQLATELGCLLLAMCSTTGAVPARITDTVAARAPGVRWSAFTVPNDLGHPLLPATASPHADSRDRRHGALSTMRNLALLIARMVGWRTVLLLDDDIVVPSAMTVREGARRLGPAAAIGLTVGRFPDNSVVCHAHRVAGGEQDVFVGAAALLIDTSLPFAFFPNIYNEDWLFLYDAVSERTVGCFGRVRQHPYDPFSDLHRARAEEFGDVIAEGLMSALPATPGLCPPLDAGYWNEFLAARHRFIRDAYHRLLERRDPVAMGALRSLDAARHRLRGITGRDCADYIRRWRADLLMWHELLARLGPREDVDDAAAYLGLNDTLAGLIA
jgi:hypothetical protein